MRISNPTIWIVLTAFAVMALFVTHRYYSNKSEVELTNSTVVSPVISGAHPVSNQPIQPITAPSNLNHNKITLGERLFHDTNLSGDRTVSCASCHTLASGGADNSPTSVGVNGLSGELNSPTVFNSSLNIAQFWDGRAETLESQMDGPVHNPKEMGSSWVEIIDTLKANKEYSKWFEELYDDGITAQTIKDSIATFENSLVTLNAPFDRFLLGDESAISENAKLGYKKFKEYGCVACHQGSNVGGNLYQRLGIMGDYFADRGTGVKAVDLGRYNVTGLDEDMHVFKVPSLRLAALTAPYFHDGSASTLKEAVRVMIKYQLGRTATEQDENLIVEFIHSLVGNYQGQRLME